MPRLAFRSFFWLSVPCLFIPLIGALASHWRGRDSVMQVKSAKRTAPSPAGAESGADVGVSLDLDADTSQYANFAWSGGARIEAGQHLLWDSKRVGVVCPILNRQESGGAGQWFRGDFALQKVPLAWGDVVYRYDFGLSTTRRIGLGSWIVGHWNQQHRASGSVLLRRTNEELTGWKHVSHSPHLKFVGYELHSVKDMSGFPGYYVRVFFEKIPPDVAGNSSDLKAKFDWRGRRGDYPEETSLETAYGTSGDIYNANGAREQSELRHFGSVYYAFEPDESARLGRLKLKVWRGNDWPMTLEVPFSDAQGHVLVHKDKSPISAQCFGCD